MAVLPEGRNWRKWEFVWFREATFRYWGWCRTAAVFSPIRTIKYQEDIPSPSPVTAGGADDSRRNHSSPERQLRSDPPFTALWASPRANSLALRSVSVRISGFPLQWRLRFPRDGTD